MRNMSKNTDRVYQFPGGYFQISRCSDGSYWAHINLHDGPKRMGDPDEYTESLESRVMYRGGSTINSVLNEKDCVAVALKFERVKEEQ